MALADELVSILRAGYSLIGTITWEEERVEAALAAIATDAKRNLKTWTASRGISGSGSNREPLELLEAIAGEGGPSIWLLKDFHPYLSDPRVVRGLRDLASEAKPSIRAIVIVAPD